MSEWIEKLKQSGDRMHYMRYALENGDPDGVMIRASLWPLVCDVVEATDQAGATSPLVARDEESGEFLLVPVREIQSVRAALAALKAEVEKPEAESCDVPSADCG